MVSINTWALAVVIIDLGVGILLYKGARGIGRQRAANIAGWIGSIIGVYGLVRSGVLTNLALGVNLMFWFSILAIIAILMAIALRDKPHWYLNDFFRPILVNFPKAGIWISGVIIVACQILQP